MLTPVMCTCIIPNSTRDPLCPFHGDQARVEADVARANLLADSKPEPPKGVPAGPRTITLTPDQVEVVKKALYAGSVECLITDEQADEIEKLLVPMPPRVQNLPIPGMEAMTDEQIRSKLVILLRRKTELENQLKGCENAIDTGLMILEERHP